MAKKRTDGVEQHINATKLKQLLAADKVATSRMAEERGALAARIKGAQESDNLDLQVFGIIKRIAKLPPQTLAQRWRTIMLYGDMLGFNDQGDIEDFIKEQPDTRTTVERAMDGEPVSQEERDEAQRRVDEAKAERARQEQEVLDGGGANKAVSDKASGALRTFRSAIADMPSDQTGIDAINKGLERLSADFPEIADEALEAAQDRLREIAAAQGGGEDLRPRHLQEAEQMTADKPKRTRRSGEAETVH